MAISARLKALSYLVKPRPYAIEKPVVLQFPVIDICNSQCQMCRIWENKKSDDMTPADLRLGLRNPLFSEVGAVGVNGGEPTLRKDLAELVGVLFEELPRLRGISLITNAYKTDEVIARVAEVGEVVRRHGGTFDVMVSLDGVGEVHDLVRGKPGNFERAQKVLDFLQSSELVTSVRVGCTIIKANVHGLADLLEHCRGRGVYVKYRLGIPHQRLYTLNLADPYALTPAEKYEVAEFIHGLIAHYETDEQQKFFYRSLADQLTSNVPRQAGCDWQHRGATITSRGELLYCAVQSKALGRIQDGNSEQSYFGNAAHLREIIDTKCATCNHDYVGIPPKAQYLKQIVLRTARGFGLEPLLRRTFHGSGLQAWTERRTFYRRLARMRGLAAQQLPVAGTASPVRRILLCGWYGTETLGDKAILAGVMQALTQAGGAAEFTLVSLNPYVSEMSRRQMPELKGCRIVGPQEGARLVAGMDLVVLAGGPLMAIDDLADMESLFATARARGIPAMLAGCGVGPLGSPWHDASLRRLLSQAPLRIFRDENSRALAAKLGIDVSRDAVAEDPAFTWLREQRGRLSGRPPADRKVLLLGLRDFPAQAYGRHLDVASREEAGRRFEAEILRALETLAQQHPDLQIRPLPMCTNHFGDDDRWFYRRLFRGNDLLQRRLDLSLLGAELSPLEYAEAFRSAHVALAMRFHSLVFALGLEVPAVAIDYTLGRGKVHALAERFKVPCQSLAELSAGFVVSEVNRLLLEPAPQARGFEPEFIRSVSHSLARLADDKGRPGPARAAVA